MNAQTLAPPLPAAICYALVPCAGVGQRAGTVGPKQYEPLAGRPVVAHTLAALAAVPTLRATLVVLAPDDSRFETLLPDFVGERGWVARVGGATRAASVAAGLQALRERGAGEHDWVLVHDAARCLLRPQWVQRLIDACRDDAVGGLLALPLADTLKQAGAVVDRAAERAAERAADRAADPATASAPEPRSGTARVHATLPREAKWLAQTPQMFRLGLLQRALAAAGDAVTDESSAIEALPGTPRLAPLLVPGEIENLKLTWPADFALAVRLLRTRD